MGRARACTWLVMATLPACVVDYALTADKDPVLLPEDVTEADTLPVDSDTVDTPEAHDTAAPVVDEPVEEPPVVDDDPPPADDCDHTSDLVYVLSRGDDTVYLFDPTTLGLTRVGALSCNTWSDPGSMAVTRDGRLFVRYGDQTIHEVDLQTMACTQTPYNDRRTGFGAFGMGFATSQAGTWRDNLFIANGSEVARLDTTTWQLTPLGSMPSQSELTGNAAGELWAFFPLERPAALVHADQASGAVQQILPLAGFPNPIDIDAFAFAHWGGEFFLFVRTYGVGNSSDVYRVTASGQMTRVVTRLGIDIVGAGVSTCAPTQ